MSRIAKQEKKKDVFEAAIEAKEAEIETVNKKLEKADADPVQVVAWQKKKRILDAELEALKAAQKAANYVPAEPSDREELLEGLKKYKEEHGARIAKIQEDIQDIEREAAQIEKDLQIAAKEGNTDKTIALSDRREDLKKKRQYVREMLSRAEELPIYPDGVLKEEWLKICNRVKPEWDNKIKELRTLASVYKDAAESFLKLFRTISEARNEVEGLQPGLFLPTFFTAESTEADLIIEKTYFSQISNVFTDAMHSRPI